MHRRSDRLDRAFDHFGFERYEAFLAMARNAPPDNGIMLLHTITGKTYPELIDQGVPLTFEVARFIKFMPTEIFPGGRIPSIEKVEEHPAPAGFAVTRRQSLQLHYVRTLDLWAEALESRKGKAIAIQSEEVYERYMRYLTGCANAFRVGYIDVNQFTMAK